MKIQSFMVILLLSVTSVLTCRSAVGFQAAPPEKRKPSLESAEIRALKSEFNQIDVASRLNEADVRVNIEGDNQSTGKINIRVLRQPQRSITATAGGPERRAENEARVNATIADTPLHLETFSFDLSILDIPDTLITQTIVSVFTKTNALGELAGVKVRQLGATANYEVIEDYTYQYGPYKITVPSGFVYDRASIPRIFWVLMDKDSLSNVAPLFHDFLYRNGGKPPKNLVFPYHTFTREDTDNLFFELMTKCGVETWRRQAAYKAVRNFSGFAWQG
jgi:hypothetical protein